LLISYLGRELALSGMERNEICLKDIDHDNAQEIFTADGTRGSSVGTQRAASAGVLI
jgi:hypothetical protein